MFFFFSTASGIFSPDWSMCRSVPSFCSEHEISAQWEKHEELQELSKQYENTAAGKILDSNTNDNPLKVS